MKEATGELNMTVITVVAIAAVGAFFIAFIWPAIQSNLENTTKCNSATNCVIGTPAGSKTCTYIGEGEGGKQVTEQIVCPLTEGDKTE